MPRPLVVHPQCPTSCPTPARRFFGVPVEQVDLQSFAFPPGKVLGVLLQYPDTEGRVEDMRGVVEKTHAAGVSHSIALASHTVQSAVSAGPRCCRNRSAGTVRVRATRGSWSRHMSGELAAVWRAPRVRGAACWVFLCEE